MFYDRQTIFLLLSFICEHLTLVLYEGQSEITESCPMVYFRFLLEDYNCILKKDKSKLYSTSILCKETHQDQDSYWWNAETTITHQDLWLGN